MHILPLCITLAATTFGSALAWGGEGHEIVATIAQAYLHPSTTKALCEILPQESGCHLATVATWADQVKRRYPKTAPMHYVNPLSDDPPTSCSFGQQGWRDEEVNVITAIMNMTAQVRDNAIADKDTPLRFLVHFVGDLHQPLHLTGKDKGGNLVHVRFEGHASNLHSVWDSGILNQKLRNMDNYTSPTSNKQLEKALRGARYDPYVRFIVQEGIRGWWAGDVEATWAGCPADGDPYPTSKLGDARKLRTGAASLWHQAKRLIFKTLPLNALAAYQQPLSFIAGDEDPLVPNYRDFDSQMVKVSSLSRKGGDGDGDEIFPACPFTWGSIMHPLNCEYAWPANLEASMTRTAPELDTDEYMGRINEDKVVERVLAMGGIRLAAILNSVLAAPGAMQSSDQQFYPVVKPL